MGQIVLKGGGLMKSRLLIGSFFVFSTLLLLGSCGKSGSSNNPASDSTAISGTIAGTAWRYRYGVAVHPAGSKVWVVSLSDREVGGDICKVPVLKWGETVRYVSFFVNDLRLGDLDYTLGSGKGTVRLSKTAATASGLSGSAVGAFGAGKITEVTAQNFRGNLSVFGDEGNKVSGSFFVKLCP